MIGRRSRRDDSGSTLIMSVIVMMLLSTLSIAGLARVLSMVAYNRHAQNYDAGLAEADAGLSAALYLVNTAPPAAAVTGSGSSGQGTWQYRVAPVTGNPAEYEAWSVGTVGSSTHAVESLLVRHTPYALFTQQALNLTGGSFTISSWASLNGPDTGQAYVGSNTSIVCNGGNSGAAQYAPSQSNSCPNPQPLNDPENMDPPTVPPGNNNGCPGSISTISGLTTTVDGKNGLPYACDVDVTWSGVVNVINPPFILYLYKDPNNTTQGYGGPALDIHKAVVNSGLTATNVQIYKAGSGDLKMDAGSVTASLTFSGVIYAPQSAVTIQSPSWYTGSLTFASATFINHPLITLGFDLSVKNLGRNWTISQYKEIPASQAQLS